MSLEKKVKIALIKEDMVQADLASKIGISDSYLRDLLKGNRTSKVRIQQIKDWLSEIDSAKRDKNEV